MPANALHDLFSKELRFVLSAHQQTVQGAGARQNTATDPRLKRLLDAGSRVHRKQAQRLEKVVASAQIVSSPRHERSIAGINEATTAMLSETSNPVERDLIQIAMAQVAIHYFLAKYVTLRAYARSLGNKRAAALLDKTLDENSAGDAQFTKLARDIVARSQKAEPSAAPKSSNGGGTLLAVVIAGVVAAGLYANENRKTQSA